MKPSIGRIVHYIGAGNRHLAAIITAVWPGGVNPHVQGETVDLELFGNLSTKFANGIPEKADGSRTYTWHWPERVD